MSDEPTVNVDLVRRTMAAIRSNPEAWDQGSFIGENDCGTTYCFAGWAITLTHGPGWWAFAAGGGASNDPEDEAIAILGFTDDQVDTIFYSRSHLNHDVDAFERHVTEVTGVTFEASA